MDVRMVISKWLYPNRVWLPNLKIHRETTAQTLPLRCRPVLVCAVWCCLSLSVHSTEGPEGPGGGLRLRLSVALGPLSLVYQLTKEVRNAINADADANIKNSSLLQHCLTP